jgi:hypothetical protein
MFFDKFSDTNRLIFSKLKDTVNNEENNVIGELEDLKRRVRVYLGEEVLLNQDTMDSLYPKSDVYLRKKIKN